MLLALDTSTAWASVALYDGQQVLSETTWLAGREHSTRLLIEVQAALERLGQPVQHLAGLVVALGPGSFTGVRVGLSVAKGIAAGLALPVWGVSSLDVLAHAAGETDLPVRAVLEAGRGRYATALYAHERLAEPARLATLEQLVALAAQPVLVIGELTLDARERLAQQQSARVAPPAACLRRAGFLAELGWQMAQRGEPGDARLLDAVYIS
ncbi:MAG TPA: tRNA (adenosine(37)-N6)-threonylcarbamoyltransferase complex dimerization subunit type 1 TsaB [Chloroflexota bacterium]